MPELLGMGVTHAPMFQFPDENMAGRKGMTSYEY